MSPVGLSSMMSPCVSAEGLSGVSLRQQAIQILRTQILIGALAPGRLYSIGEIAEQLGVSPTPVREALLHLAGERLIVMVRNRGFLVREADDHDLNELAECRYYLEVPAVESLAQKSKLAARALLVDLASQTEEAAAEGDLLSFLTADRQFHVLLLSETGNSRLVEIVTTLRDQTRLQGLMRLRGSQELLSSAQEHRALIDLIEAGNVQDVRDLMVKHLRHTRELWAGFQRTSAE